MKNEILDVDYTLYKVVGNGSVSSIDIGEGRFVPAVIVDAEKDLSDLIELQKRASPGDAETRWGAAKSFFTPKSLILSINWLKPMKLSFGIEFELQSEYSLIDGIVHSHALYLISGKAGDKVSKKFDNGILIEVPDGGFDKKWNKMLSQVIEKKYKKLGVPKKERQTISDSHINSMRDIWKFRREN